MVEGMSCERDDADGPDRWLRKCPASATARMDPIDVEEMFWARAGAGGPD